MHRIMWEYLRRIPDKIQCGQENSPERLITKLRFKGYGKGGFFFFQAKRKTCKKDGENKVHSAIKGLREILYNMNYCESWWWRWRVSAG